MANGAVRSTHYSEAALAAELERLGLRFVTSSAEDVLPSALSPADLIAALASSKEARLRMALIPLFIAHPEYSRFVSQVSQELIGQAQVTLVCYYTAAILLQRKYAQRLLQLGLKVSELPDIFGHSLALPLNSSADDLLLCLAEQQTQMSGRPINWYGTYEHAMERFIRRLELEVQWRNGERR